MNHKTDMQAALQACVDAMLHDGVPTDPYHPRRVALAAAEAALAGQSAGVPDEPKRGTDAQILFERELTCEAINGAIAFGYQNTNQPPSDDHWLAPFWKIGRKQAELEAVLSGPSSSETIHQVWVQETSSWADVTPDYYSERLPSNRRKVYYTPTFSGCPDAQAGERGAIYVECRECAECGHIGINDSHPTDAACDYSCDWTGPSPIKDKCPGCGNENVMTDACPKCSGRYKFMADATIQTSVAAPKAEAAQGVALDGIEAFLRKCASECQRLSQIDTDMNYWDAGLRLVEAAEILRDMPECAAPSPDREQVGEAAEGCTPEFLDAAIAQMNGLLDTFENDSNAEARKEARSAIHMFYQRALMTGGVKFLNCCDTPSLCSSVRRCTAQDAEQPKQSVPAPLSEYHEDTGAVVWWTWQDGLWLGEPAWIGMPDDSDWPGYHTHWTYHPEFPLPPLAEHPSEHGEQDCPHGVDDGACKQCYGEAVRGSCPDGSVCEIGCFGECEKRAASAPTLGECRINKYRSDVCERGTKGCDRLDHAVAQTLNSQPQAAEPLIHWRDKPQNIALLAVERGDPVDCDGTFVCPICGKDEPHQHSSEEIAKFRTTQLQAADPKGCPRCKSSTAAGCNDIGCGYLDSAAPKGLTDEERSAIRSASLNSYMTTAQRDCLRALLEKNGGGNDK